MVTPHAAFLALRWAPDAVLDNLANLKADFAIYDKWGFRDSVNVDTGSVSDFYLSLDQGIIMAAIGNALADDVLRDAFATKEFRKVLQPVIGHGDVQRRSARRGRCRACTRDIGSSGSAARIAWFEEAGAQAERNRPGPAPVLPAPDRRRGEVRAADR